MYGEFEFDVIEKTYLDDSRRLELKVSWRGISITDDRLYKYWSSANPEIPEADKCEYVSECSDFIACWEVLCKLFDKYDKPIWIYITDDQSFFGYVIKGTLYTVGIHDGILSIHFATNSYQYDLSDKEFNKRVLDDFGFRISLC